MKFWKVNSYVKILKGEDIFGATNLLIGHFLFIRKMWVIDIERIHEDYEYIKDKICNSDERFLDEMFEKVESINYSKDKCIVAIGSSYYLNIFGQLICGSGNYVLSLEKDNVTSAFSLEINKNLKEIVVIEERD